MYTDYSKYNYDLIEEKRRDEYIERDKAAYKVTLTKWFQENLNDIVERKWELEDISYLSEVSDFIKLLEEAEGLYELGFYTSCIALIGMSSEDFAKYLAIKLGEDGLAEKKQFMRLQGLNNKGLISNTIYTNLDNIRKIRNDCLHYNDNFKQKDHNELKTDALKITNDFKMVIKELSNEVLTDKEKLSLFNEINESLARKAASSNNSYVKSQDDMYLKSRNAFSKLFNISTVQDPNEKLVIKNSIFKVTEIDFEFEDGEMTLMDILNRHHVIVDLRGNNKLELTGQNINEGDIIQAVLISKISERGLTEVWHYLRFKKM